MMSRVALAAVLTSALGALASSEPCNPVIDGTYCATQVIRKPDGRTPDNKFTPLQGIARDIGPWTDQPATLGGITFRGSETCIGLMRRGACH